MNIQELTTWNRLSSLDFDAADVAFPFSARLARENGWTTELARQAIEEYRKFCFLAAHAGHPVTPSDEVDQVWHLHLTYSRHYWDTLCRDTLERPLHHGPTEGGGAEDRKFHDWYENTLASYRRYFGEPPRDLWPAAEERFDARHDFVRIDRRDVVTLDRTLLKRGALAALLGGSVLEFAHAFAQAGGAAAPSGSPWPILIGIALIVVVIAGVARGRRGRRGSVRKHRKGSAAAAAGYGGVACGSSGPGGSGDCAPNGDCAPGGDGGAGDGGAGDGGGAGCGGGGGGGCGGGGGGGS